MYEIMKMYIEKPERGTSAILKYAKTPRLSEIANIFFIFFSGLVRFSINVRISHLHKQSFRACENIGCICVPFYCIFTKNGRLKFI